MKTELLERSKVCGGSALGVVEADCNLKRCRAGGCTIDNPRLVLEEMIGFYFRPTRYNSWLAQLRARNRLWKQRPRYCSSQRCLLLRPMEGRRAIPLIGSLFGHRSLRRGSVADCSPGSKGEAFNVLRAQLNSPCMVEFLTTLRFSTSWSMCQTRNRC
jgi:hypothetical protein